jgi:uncharacterized protein YdaL
MKIRHIVFVILFLMTAIGVSGCGGGGGGSSSTPETPPGSGNGPDPLPPSESKKVLVLYDSAGTFGWIGKADALLLENLLGHFEVEIDTKPISKYQDNELSTYRTVFYLGTSYFDTIPAAGYTDFFQDTAEYDVPVVWLNYNLRHLQDAWDQNQWNGMGFEEATGFAFKRIETNVPYNRVKYKNTELFKGVVPFAIPGADVSTCIPDEKWNAFACAKELVVIEQSTTYDKSKVYATAYTTLDPANGQKEEPYIVQGGHFWFVGDIPFTYMYEEDRYLAFADLLHDMLSIMHEENHQAIMRLEDVRAVGTKVNDLSAIATYMEGKGLPFTVAAIPLYRDPLDYNNNGITEKKLSESNIGAVLKDLYDRGIISVVQHGYTHQLDSLINPYNGVSADDFEFLRVTDDDNDGIYNYEGPAHNDDPVWAKERIEKGKTILDQLGMEAFGWEAPHYMAGPDQYSVIGEIYPVQYARLIYYPWKDGNSRPGHEYDYVGQYFPYLIHKDAYGYTVIPENLQNISDYPNPGYRPLSSEDTLRFAKKLKVVRDAIGSFFYHPYLGTTELDRIIQGLQGMGYTFVSAPSLLEK